jgi:hypothetical protein
MGADMRAADVDVADGHVVLARRRTNPTSRPHHQAFLSADPWSRGRPMLSVAHEPGRDRRVSNDASASDARVVQTSFVHESEIVK